MIDSGGFSLYQLLILMKSNFPHLNHFDFNSLKNCMGKGQTHKQTDRQIYFATTRSNRPLRWKVDHWVGKEFGYELSVTLFSAQTKSAKRKNMLKDTLKDMSAVAKFAEKQKIFQSSSQSLYLDASCEDAKHWT